MRGAAGRDHGRPRHPGAVPDLAGPPGREWSGQATFTPPPRRDGNSFYIGSDDAGWSPPGADHQNASRKRVYHRAIDAVAGLDATRSCARSSSPRATSLVSNLGTKRASATSAATSPWRCRGSPSANSLGCKGDSLVRRRHLGRQRALFDDRGPFRNRVGHRDRQPGRPDRLRQRRRHAYPPASVTMTPRSDVLITAEELMAGWRPGKRCRSSMCAGS